MKSPNVLALATSYYDNENETISSGGVSVKYGDSSLIFSISYTDRSEEQAKGKLSALIKAASEKLPKLLEAKDVALISVQNNDVVSETTSNNKSIIFSTIIGIALAFVIVLIIYALDNTVKNKNEFEYLTGVSVIAVIDKIEEKKGKK
jgi:capsular polysaccharide biosynthesis protein